VNTATLTDDDAVAARPARRGWRGAGTLLAGAALVALAWWVSRAGWFKAGDDFGYTLGVVGGVLMLVLLLYPARKYLRALRRAGKVKRWFWMQ